MKKTLAILVLLFASLSAPACPMCKDSLPNNEGSYDELRDNYNSTGQNISGGINKSVYFMLAGLLGMMGFTSLVLVKGARSTPKR